MAPERANKRIFLLCWKKSLADGNIFFFIQPEIKFFVLLPWKATNNSGTKCFFPLPSPLSPFSSLMRYNRNHATTLRLLEFKINVEIFFSKRQIPLTALNEAYFSLNVKKYLHMYSVLIQTTKYIFMSFLAKWILL